MPATSGRHAASASEKPVIARAAVNNGQVDVPSILLDVVIVTRDNIDSTVVADGWVDKAAVSGTAP